MKLRKGVAQDVAQIVAVKDSRRLSTQSSGGFLLGSDVAGYHHLITHGDVWVLERDGQVEGFTTALGPEAFLASPLALLKDQVQWTTDMTQALTQPIAYFDQLAVRAGVPSLASARLAFVTIQDLFVQGADHVVTTTVLEPVINTAAVPFIQALEGRRVGSILETHASIGNLLSAVWLISRRQAEAAIANPSARLLARLSKQGLPARTES